MWKAAEAFGKRKKAFLCRCVAAGEVQCPQSQSGRKSYRFSARQIFSTPKCQKTKIPAPMPSQEIVVGVSLLQEMVTLIC